MLETLRELVSSKESEGCRAVVSEDPVELCGNDVYGRGGRDGPGEVLYCEDHVPSAAIPWMTGRVHEVRFYVPEADEFDVRQ